MKCKHKQGIQQQIISNMKDNKWMEVSVRFSEFNGEKPKQTDPHARSFGTEPKHE